MGQNVMVGGSLRARNRAEAVGHPVGLALQRQTAHSTANGLGLDEAISEQYCVTIHDQTCWVIQINYVCMLY